MARALQVDLAKLTKPISSLMPSGESLRRSFVYDQIKEARREDDPSLSQGVWQTEPKRADWETVESICVEATETRSKDLRIAGWLTEAWLRRHSVEGCIRGFQLTTQLVDEFWDTLHPPIEDGDVEGRLAPVAWMNDKLSITLKRTAMTEATTQDPEVFTWMDWEKASLLERAGHRATNEDITTSRFMTSVLLTKGPFYKKLVADLNTLHETVEAFEAVLDKRCGEPTAALWKFREVVISMRDFAKRALDEKVEEIPDEPDESIIEQEGWTDDDPETAVMSSSGPIRNRAEAYQRLAEVAEYLMRKEPHSPVPHLVKRAVAWGNMSFGELIAELMQDNGDIRSIYSLLGMQLPGE